MRCGWAHPILWVGLRCADDGTLALLVAGSPILGLGSLENGLEGILWVGLRFAAGLDTRACHGRDSCATILDHACTESNWKDTKAQSCAGYI